MTTILHSNRAVKGDCPATRSGSQNGGKLHPERGIPPISGGESAVGIDPTNDQGLARARGLSGGPGTRSGATPGRYGALGGAHTWHSWG